MLCTLYRNLVRQLEAIIDLMALLMCFGSCNTFSDIIALLVAPKMVTSYCE